MSDDIIIRCSALEKTYVQGDLNVEVLKGIDLSVGQGSNLAIIGSSGSGKSTLLHVLGGLDSATKGDVIIDGKKLSSLSEEGKGKLRNRCLGFVYQFHHLLPEFTALENVAMPLLIRGEDVRTAEAAAQELLGQVGLAARIQHKPAEMSGGERQRTAIARAMVTRPRCILADEPTGNLDEYTARQVFDLMMTLNEQYKISLVMVTHNTGLAEKFDRMLELKEGRLSEV